MKKVLIVFLILLNMFQYISVNAQNLVPNPSFEVDSICPNDYSQIYFAPPWFQPSIHFGNTINSANSDLYNSCDFNYVDVPQNSQGFQYAATGNGYAGIFAYNDTINTREYLEVPLLSALISQRTYCVEFHISLSNYSGRSISNLGAYFSIDSLLDTTYYRAINYVTPQVENPPINMLNDTANWMLVSGSFIANGGERFMTIGNFHIPATTNSQFFQTGSPVSYYYIDDVSVTQCNVGVGEVAEDGGISVYPNPATKTITLTTNTQQLKTIHIYNVLGECVLHQQPTTNNQQLTLDVSGFAKGIYYIEVQTEKGILRKKLVKE